MKILALPGDGIGPEIIESTLQVLEVLSSKLSLNIEIEKGLIGGAAVDAGFLPLPDETLNLAKSADAILLGAVGGPKWDNLAREKRPETGLLEIREKLDLFANLRPALLFPELVDSSTLKKEIVSGLDILIVRELTGGIYFGKPRNIQTLPSGELQAVNSMVYTNTEIERIAKVAFKIAELRNHKVCSVDKANVLEVSELWRNTVAEVGKSYENIDLSNMYVDNAAMQLVKNPKQFDVIVTGNLFGDILSDCAAMLTGSIGMLPSASMNEDEKGLYEPVHGSAPDIAGKNQANPLATMLSLSMMMKYTFKNLEAANLIELAIKNVLSDGFRTPDLALEGSSNDSKVLGTKQITEKVCDNLQSLS